MTIIQLIQKASVPVIIIVIIIVVIIKLIDYLRDIPIFIKLFDYVKKKLKGGKEDDKEI